MIQLKYIMSYIDGSSYYHLVITQIIFHIETAIKKDFYEINISHLMLKEDFGKFK